MNSHLPTFRQLRYFVALEELEHFGKAAEACFVSQSAFSVAIRELETMLGVQLVDRTRKRTTITTLGREIAVQARLCLRDAEMLVDMARQPSAPFGGRLSLGVIPTIAPFLLPGLMHALRSEHPALQLYLREEQTDHLLAELLGGKIDVVLMALPYETPHMETRTLFRDPFRLACRADTRHADPDNYRYSKLQRDSVLLLEDGHCLREHALTACRLRRSDKVSRFAASTLLTLVQMVDADLGITFLPAMAQASALLASTEVRMFPFQPEAHRDIALVWRRGSAHSEEFNLLGDLISANR